MKAKKYFGQNFLVDIQKIQNIIENLNIKDDSIILEVGPGTGALTKSLVKEAKKVYAVEIDKEISNRLGNTINNDVLRLINQDFLDFDMNEIKEDKVMFISNLPYYISTKIIFKIVDWGKASTINVMLQKELADRIISPPNNKSFSRITVALGTFYEVTNKIDVSRECFSPSPNVDSTFLFLKQRDNNIDDQESYLLFVKGCFRYKRKTLLNSLKGLYDLEKTKAWLNQNEIGLLVRAEQLTIDNFKQLWNYVK